MHASTLLPRFAAAPLREALTDSPVVLVHGPRQCGKTTLVRSQLEFTAIKAVVDRARTPGRFVLTGSANVLLVPRLADSLAGRIEILRLHPLVQCELGRLLETFVFQELRRQVSWRGEALAFFHSRDKDGVEVDIVIERGARVVP